MHDKEIEAMARAMRGDDTLMLESRGLSCTDVCGGDLKCVKRGLPRCDIQTTQSTRAAHIALTALCTSRPDLAAVLRGEAVAVPREATDAMALAALDRSPEPRQPASPVWQLYADIYRAMTAASPYEKETPHGE